MDDGRRPIESHAPGAAVHVGRYVSMGVEFVVVFGLFLGGGILLDRKYGIWPACTVGGMVLGFLGAVYRLVREASRLQRRTAPGASSPAARSVAAAAKADVAAGAPMEIRLRVLVARVIASVVVIGGLGAYPTWTWSGDGGLVAEAVAGAAGLAGAVMGAALITRAAREGAARAAAAFLPAEGYRFGVGAGSAALLWLVTDIPPVPLLIWSLGFFLAILFCETSWLVGALQRDARAGETRNVLQLLHRRVENSGADWDDV